MTNAEKFVVEQMASEIFRKANIKEKIKLELELMPDDLKEDIKNGKSSISLI